jgi:hypothetical protein
MKNLTTIRTAFAAAMTQLGSLHQEIPFQTVRGVLAGLGLVILTDEGTEMKSVYLGAWGQRWVLPVADRSTATPAHWAPGLNVYQPHQQTRLVLEWFPVGESFDVNAYLS